MVYRRTPDESHIVCPECHARLTHPPADTTPAVPAAELAPASQTLAAAAIRPANPDQMPGWVKRLIWKLFWLFIGAPMALGLIALVATSLSQPKPFHQSATVRADDAVAARGVAQVDRRRLAAAKMMVAWDRQLSDVASELPDTLAELKDAERQQVDATNATYRKLKESATDRFQKHQLNDQQKYALRSIVSAYQEQAAMAKTRLELERQKIEFEFRESQISLALAAKGQWSKIPLAVAQEKYQQARAALVAHVKGQEVKDRATMAAERAWLAKLPQRKLEMKSLKAAKH